MSVHILVADDHAIVRQGILLMIKELMLPATVSQAQDYPTLIEMLHATTQVDLLLCDINMPGGDSIKIAEIAKAIHPKIKTLIFSAYSEDLYAMRYINSGANGFLHKDASEEEIKNAIVAVLQTGRYVSKNLSESLIQKAFGNDNSASDSPWTLLSNREMEVAELLVKGLGLLEISNQLDIRVSTISTYKTRLYDKLKVSNLAELIAVYNSFY